VKSWAERESAARAAAHAPGIAKVENRLRVIWPASSDEDDSDDIC